MQELTDTARAAPDAVAPKREVRLLALREVLERTTFSRAKLYEEMSHKRFPRPISLSPGRRAWPESVVTDWIESKIAEAA